MMARGPNYRVPFRRRREGKTNYQKRRALVLSKLPRLVIRKTLQYIIVQIFRAKTIGDEIIVSAHSHELKKKFGWLGGDKNIPAAYLTGLLCGYRAKKKGIQKAVLDIGLHSPSKGARVFASLKGVLDAGIAVPHKENTLPSNARITGRHIVDHAKTTSLNPEEYERKFSRYLMRGLRPEEISDHFSLIKNTPGFKVNKK